MVEELKLAIKIDDASIEQSLLKQFANAQKMADKVVLNFKNVNFDDKQIEAKFKEMQKKAGQNPIDLTINGNTLDTLGQIDKRLAKIFSIGKGKSFIDSSSTVTDIGKIENKINELNKKYEEMQKKLSSVGSEGISGKDVSLVDNAEFQKLSQEVQNTKSELSDLKDVISNLTSDNEGLGNFADQLDDRLRGLDNTVLDLTKRLQTLYSVIEQNPETNISLSSDSTVEQQIKSESELNAEIEKRENIIRELQQLQEKLTVHEDFHGNDRYFADQLPTEEEIREADKRIKQLTGTNNIFNVDKLIQDRNEWLSEVKYSLEEYDNLIKANDQKALDEYTTRGLSRIGGAESFFGYEDNNFSIASKFVEEKEKIQNEINDLYTDLDKLDEKMNLDSNNSSVDNTVQSQEKLQSELKETQKQAEKTAQAVKESTATDSTEHRKDAFPDSSTDTRLETEGMEKVEKATEEAIQAKKDFATANEGVQSSIDGSKSPLQLEAELMDQIDKSAREAADAKKKFVEANKQVKNSANKSNRDLIDGHSENAEPSGVKKYKKKGYKAHDTGNHDNEKKVSNKAELGQALKELQSEIIASIDESTFFVKEITDFYDSQNNLVKTQTKVGDKNGGVRTYTHSYSMDNEGNTTAWTSHIDSKKYQDQNKIIQEQIKNLQRLSAEKQKVEEPERKPTVSQASKDQLEAWKQIQRIRKEIAGTSNTNIIQQLKQEKKSYQEQFNVATKILKNNSDLYNSEQRLNELKKISLKTIQQIESTQHKQLNGYDNKLSGYKGKVSGYKATIDKFGKDGWTSPTYLQKVKEAQQALEAYENEINRLKANPDLVNKKSLANVEKLGKDFENATISIKNMTAAQKGYTQLGAEKALDKIAQMVKENSKMSRQAKADIQAWYNQIKSGNPSASLDVILGKVESIVRAEKEAGRGGKSMWDAIKEKAWYGAASAIGTYFGVNDIFRYGQQAVSTIVELDTALVDLKKTTSMSSSELENFYYDSNNVAKQMGVTTKEIIDQASAWSRLGYSSQEAATTMAKLSSKFASISPGMSTDEAQEGLVSIMKAFDIDPNDVETEIMDKVNILGNKFAEENQDVVEGLKRSSAAMAAMGQTFTDTAALFTGGMEILQDAESMGTALRTLSMRVRGYDEETEELSDDLVNVTGEVADLTKTAKDAQGVSLFTDATQEHYKSMVEYLGEISDRWDQISEKNQTELLQKLFGKNRANAGAAIIQNFDQVRSAIEAMDESAGSSDKEMSTIEQSLEYKINSLKETWVGTVQQMIDRGDIGKVVDALTKISESIGFVVDKLGLLKTTVLGVTAALSFKNVGRDKMYSPTCFEYADHIHNLLWIHRFRVC